MNEPRSLFADVRVALQLGREATNELVVRRGETPPLDAHDPFGAALEALREIEAMLND